MAEAERPAHAERATLWRAVRQDPGHAAELAVLHALPQLSDHVVGWRQATAATYPDDRPDQLARRVLHQSARVARRGGAITGSTFYVAMVPAMAMIYCEQLVVVLRIAAIYGRDPTDAARAAEILVVQGRYPSVTAATKALQSAGARSVRSGEPGGWAPVARALRQLPSMIGLQLKLRTRSPIDVAIGIVEVLSFVVPVVSIPVWMVANARATRRLGRAAANFYARPPAPIGVDAELTLPRRTTRRTRWLAIGALVPLTLVLGVLFSLLPLGGYHLGVRWLGLALAELALVLTIARLIQLTGGNATFSSAPQSMTGAWSPPSGASSGDRSGTEDLELRLDRSLSVIDVDVETRTGRCSTHGPVESRRELPRLQFPYTVFAVRRLWAHRRPFRCPACHQEVVLTGAPGRP